jgi:2-polyprenyl-3-methyl-5-hydroxy-6-metoxy-1,4-benzoquinol methylase
MDDEQQRQEGIDWDRTKYHSEYNAVLAEYMVRDCLEQARGANVLDLACGAGTLTAMLRGRFKRIVGVDASSKHLEQARAALPEAEFHQCLIEDFTSAERFGTILMLNILEHVVDPVAILRKAATFLEKDGVLIAHVPNALAVNRRIAVMMGTLEHAEELSPFDINVAGHRRSYTRATLEADVRQAGLAVRRTGGIFYKMLSTPQMDWLLREGPWEEGGFGWGRVGAEKSRDWKAAFCRACYEIGKEMPEECNLIAVTASLPG